MNAPISISLALIEALRAARAVVVLTGAGVSAESGVPTFREAQTGLWAQYNPEELATPAAFRRNPRLVWEWYAWRRQQVAEVQPNPGHFALAEMERHLVGHAARFTLITQNVDGLHHQAGNRQIIELHGNIRRVKCFEANHPAESWEEQGELPPRCPRCGSPLRPDVVWFGEMLPAAGLEAAWQAAERCNVFLSIGTSALVQPAASLPLVAAERGARLVEVNPTSTPLSPYANDLLPGPAGLVLPELVRAVWGSGDEP